MKTGARVRCGVASLLVAMMFIPLCRVTAQVVPTTSPGYIENKGQWDEAVRYKATLNGVTVWVTDNKLVYDVIGGMVPTGRKTLQPGKFTGINDELKDEMAMKHHVVTMELLGANSPNSVPQYSQPGNYNFFSGNDQSKWVTGAVKYSEVVMQEVYPGVDLKLLSNNGAPRYDFVVSPGVNPDVITMKISGAEGLYLNTDGSLVMKTSCGDVINGSLVAYQIINGQKQEVVCALKVSGNKVSFDVGAYDKSKALIIDPTVYSTYLGTDGQEAINGVKIVPEGTDVVVVGTTSASTFPKTNGAYTKVGGAEEVFVAKYDAKLRTLKFSSVIGGSSSDKGWDLAIGTNTQHSIFIVGETNSNNFPTTSGVVSQLIYGGVDVFVAKLSNDGSKLLYSTYFGGSADDRGYGITVDVNDQAYFCGETNSNNFKTSTGAFRTTSYGGGDGFISSLLASGSMNFSEYYGGGARDVCRDIATAPNIDDIVYVTGDTKSGDLQLYPETFVPGGGWGGGSYRKDAAQQKLNATGTGDFTDAFFVKVTDKGVKLAISTYMGGNGDDVGYSIIVDATATPTIVGSTKSNNLNLIRQYPQNKKGGFDVLLCELKADGKSFTYTSYFGGDGDDIAYDVKSDGSNLVLVGKTTSSNLPIANNAEQQQVSLLGDGFIANLSYDNLVYGSYIGSSEAEQLNSVAILNPSICYIAGTTASNKLPINDSAQQKGFAGFEDGYLASYTFSTLSVSTPASNEKPCAGSPLNISWEYSTFNATTDAFLIESSSDNGANWSIVKSNVKAKSFNWIIPQNQEASNKYRVRVTQMATGLTALNSGGFTIRRAPVVTNKTADTAICSGLPITLGFTVTGDDLKYQWKKNGTDIPGATGLTYQIPSATNADAADYTIQITGSCTNGFASNPIKLTINPVPTFTQDLTDKQFKEGTPTTFEVVVAGSGLTYKWQKNTGGGWTNISNAPDAPKYTINNTQKFDEGKYRVIVSGNCGADTSAESALSLQVGVTENQTFDGLLSITSLTPNPMVDNASVVVESKYNAPIVVSIVDAVGNTVMKFNANNGTATFFTIEKLAQGSYKLLVECESKRVFKNFVIVK
ncbi:MAG: SBBP repeat-containing protein [Candidatus Kapaibacterium sp.]